MLPYAWWMTEYGSGWLEYLEESKWCCVHGWRRQCWRRGVDTTESVLETRCWRDGVTDLSSTSGLSWTERYWTVHARQRRTPKLGQWMHLCGRIWAVDNNNTPFRKADVHMTSSVTITVSDGRSQLKICTQIRLSHVI